MGNLVVDQLPVIIFPKHHRIEHVVHKASGHDADPKSLHFLGSSGRIEHGKCALDRCVVEQEDAVQQPPVVATLREVDRHVASSLSCAILGEPTIKEGLIGGYTDSVFCRSVDGLDGVQEGGTLLANERVLHPRPLALSTSVGDFRKQSAKVIDPLFQRVEAVCRVLATAFNEVGIDLCPR